MLTRIALTLLVAVTVASCKARNLYVAHDVVVGLNAQVSADRQQGRLIVGYDRDFVTIIPKSVDKSGSSGTKDAMALLSCNALEIDGIFLTRYVDALASGEAAQEFAKKLGNSTTFFDCHKKGSSKQTENGGDGQ